MSPGYPNNLTILFINILLPIICYNNKIISLYFNCNGETSTLILHFYLIVALRQKLQAETCSERDE